MHKLGNNINQLQFNFECSFPTKWSETTSLIVKSVSFLISFMYKQHRKTFNLYTICNKIRASSPFGQSNLELNCFLNYTNLTEGKAYSFHLQRKSLSFIIFIYTMFITMGKELLKGYTKIVTMERWGFSVWVNRFYIHYKVMLGIINRNCHSLFED